MNEKGEKKWLNHLLNRQKQYLFITAGVILLIPFLINLVKGNVLLRGREGYYLLEFLFPVNPIILAFLGPILGLVSLWLFLRLTAKSTFSPQFVLIFSWLMITSPLFIYYYSIFSLWGLFTFLLLLGLVLLSQQERWQQVAGLIPLFIASNFDLFSTLLVLLTICIVYFGERRYDCPPTRKHIYILAMILTLVSLVMVLIQNQPFVQGPFQQEDQLTSLISDLGGIGGISIFVLILAIIGVSLSWKRKYFPSVYFFLPLVFISFLIYGQALFPFAVLCLFFASVGCAYLVERKWILPTLKNFTLFLLVLGILFSLLSYVDRIENLGPGKEEISVLSWVQQNTAKDKIVFSTPENGLWIRYFAQREPFYAYPPIHKEKENVTQSIFHAEYVSELFPLLDGENISLLFLTGDVKRDLPQDRGFLFLLKNERFKLVYSSGNAEVWVYKKE